MSWIVEFYNESVEEAILTMPPKIQARMIKLLELIETHGANFGPPHTEAMGYLRFAQKLKKESGNRFIAI